MKFTFSNDIGLYIYIFTNEKMVFSYIFKIEFEIIKSRLKIQTAFYAKEQAILLVFLQSILKIKPLVYRANSFFKMPSRISKTFSTQGGA